MLKTTILAATLIILAGPIAARTTGYHCTVDGTTPRQWIQAEVFIEHDQDTDRVLVSDPAILAFNDMRPVEGRVIRDNDKRVTFGWILQLRSAANEKVAMQYRATFVKSNQRFTITAQPTGYSNMFNRMGRCGMTEVKR